MRGEELVVVADTGHRLRPAEPPSPHAEPAEILHRIAAVDELPVEDGSEAVGADDEVPEPEVAVHDGRRSRIRTVRFQPAERELDAGWGWPDWSSTSRYWTELIGVDEICHRGRIRAVQRRALDRAEREDPAGCGELVVTQDLAGDRLSLDVAEDQVGGAEIGRVRAGGDDLGHGNPCRRPDPQRGRLDRHVALRTRALALQHHPLAVTVRADRDEGPRLPRRTTGQRTRSSTSRAPTRGRGAQPARRRPSTGGAGGGYGFTAPPPPGWISKCRWGVPRRSRVPDVADHIAGVDRAAFLIAAQVGVEVAVPVVAEQPDHVPAERHPLLLRRSADDGDDRRASY